ncbi:MAG: HAD-IIIC family phosphatase [Clostridiales bacterium]|nr:HAD-IIIC family phosphatase [Clostridiales bacterium]
MSELEYPFDGAYLLKKRKSIKRELLARIEQLEQSGTKILTKKIAVLGGSTTHDIKDILELFLLNYGIKPEFYESEYAQYWNDIMFDNAELSEFKPDIIFIHTSTRNITSFPTVRDSAESINAMLDNQFSHFEQMWSKAFETYKCPIVQNNFEQPFYRLLGNRDVWDFHGRCNFVSRLNQRFYEYAQIRENFYINDIDYMASCYGLQKWADPFYWHMYKYALCVDAIPEFAYNLANIIKSIYGKNKKAIVCDLDNTLWGGIVGDDGAENIEIGQETSVGQLYSEFQTYLKAHKDLGVLLTVDSKNDEENALAGLNRPDSILKPDDFIVVKANWDPKDLNLVETAKELNIGNDALVFIDDNPAEREIVRAQVGGVAVPEMSAPERYINVLDRSGFFEVTAFSADDLSRNEMYKANVERAKQEASFADYGEYLKSLEMKAEIKPFAPIYMSRIAQLTNKSNQFNLTTLRCTQADIERVAADGNYITLYGKLEDKFGDNGVVSVVFGHIDESEKILFHIDLWLMSCRVLKRDMEFAMMDSLSAECKSRGIKKIRGYYYPTSKNKMVKDFYALHGFARVSEDADGNAIWERKIEDYENKNKVIEVNK